MGQRAVRLPASGVGVALGWRRRGGLGRRDRDRSSKKRSESKATTSDALEASHNRNQRAMIKQHRRRRMRRTSESKPTSSRASLLHLRTAHTSRKGDMLHLLSVRRLPPAVVFLSSRGARFHLVTSATLGRRRLTASWGGVGPFCFRSFTRLLFRVRAGLVNGEAPVRSAQLCSVNGGGGVMRTGCGGRHTGGSPSRPLADIASAAACRIVCSTQPR